MDTKDERSEYVTLMTIHTAKWLEEQNVFVTGIEEWIFPSFRSVNDPHALEEERRLMYVAMTRAREKLYLSRASERFHFWEYVRNPASRFLAEVPEKYIENYDTSEFIRNVKSLFSFWNDTFSHSTSGTTLTRKIKVQNNDVSTFHTWDKVSHPKFGNGIITHLNGELAEIAFSWVWVKKMNIRIAPVRKI
jgi:DNA helicase-2/ATP-dependent DNA helicase PcrA